MNIHLGVDTKCEDFFFSFVNAHRKTCMTEEALKNYQADKMSWPVTLASLHDYLARTNMMGI